MRPLFAWSLCRPLCNLACVLWESLKDCLIHRGIQLYSFRRTPHQLFLIITIRHWEQLRFYSVAQRCVKIPERGPRAKPWTLQLLWTTTLQLLPCFFCFIQVSHFVERQGQQTIMQIDRGKVHCHLSLEMAGNHVLAHACCRFVLWLLWLPPSFQKHACQIHWRLFTSCRLI